MATRTRYKSSSPAPAPSGTMTLDSTPSPPSIRAALSPPHPVSPLTSILSKESFPSPPRPQPTQRRSELAVLNFHNARPPGNSSIVLPVSTARAEDSSEEWRVGSNGTVSTPAPRDRLTEQEPTQRQPRMRPGWGSPKTSSTVEPASPPQQTEKSRSLSIQSLISSPTAGQPRDGNERGMKRKGSYDNDEQDAASRHSRGGSVISTSRLSMEDPDVRDAVEALGDLKADLTHPSAPRSPPAAAPTREPLMNLIQSSAAVHPLLSTALSISSSTYAASKNYIAPFRYVAESAENLTGPVVSAVGRRTGIEDYIRRGLTRARSDDSENNSAATTKRRKSEKDVEGAKDKGQLVEVAARSEPGWQKRLYYTSTGLATALSDDSRRSLKYCLRILFNANANLVKMIETLQSVVNELDSYLEAESKKNDDGDGVIAGYLPEGYEQRRQRLAETIDKLKDEALKTLKTVVDTVSRYAGGALPEQARGLVKMQILAFPVRWQAAACVTPVASQPTSPKSTEAVLSTKDGATRRGDAEDIENENVPMKNKAVRVLVMVREGLEMMRSVSEVMEGTLISADEWCDRFGKKRDDEPVAAAAEKPATRGHKKTVSWVDDKQEPQEDKDVVMSDKS